MFKNLYNKIFKSKNYKNVTPTETDDYTKTLVKLNEALYPSDNLKVVYEDITKYIIKGITYKLGDKVICRSNECDPLMVGTIVEFWNNDSKWANCIPQVEVEGKVWGVMGHIKPYSEELMEILEPMKALEQWNYLIPDHLKKMYSYSEDDMVRKEKQYKRVKKIKEQNSSQSN